MSEIPKINGQSTLCGTKLEPQAQISTISSLMAKLFGAKLFFYQVKHA